VNTELILQGLFCRSVLAAEEMTDAAIYSEDLSMRDRGDVHMAFRAGEAFVDGLIQIIFCFFLVAGKAVFRGCCWYCVDEKEKKNGNERQKIR
jgi:hypothetical protein